MQDTLPPYLFCTSSDFPGAGVICKTIQPANFGIVLKFDDPDRLQRWKDTSGKEVEYAQIAGYMIVIYPAAYQEWATDPLQVLLDMCKYYYAEKIQRNAGYYKRNQIQG